MTGNRLRWFGTLGGPRGVLCRGDAPSRPPGARIDAGPARAFAMVARCTDCGAGGFPGHAPQPLRHQLPTRGGTNHDRTRSLASAYAASGLRVMVLELGLRTSPPSPSELKIDPFAGGQPRSFGGGDDTGITSHCRVRAEWAFSLQERRRRDRRSYRLG